MDIVIRVDASNNIGSGHVMRCIALAGELKAAGMSVYFICRDLPGQMVSQIQSYGFKVTLLPRPEKNYIPVDNDLYHADFLAVSWLKDAEDTIRAIGPKLCDWLIVDNYAIDARWHNKLRIMTSHIFVIDDLADRKLDCDLLLDQTFGRKHSDYQARINGNSKSLLGPRYALLRQEFINMREYSLTRRVSPELNHLLITMGGIDSKNLTSYLLDKLDKCSLPIGLTITIVMGVNAPNLKSVYRIAKKMQNPIRVKINVSDMATIMSNSDLAIGAAGSTSWERCCLGLPSLMIVLAKNQQKISESLTAANAAILIGEPFSLGFDQQLKKTLLLCFSQPEKLSEMSRVAADITDGYGATRVTQELIQASKT